MFRNTFMVFVCLVCPHLLAAGSAAQPVSFPGAEGVTLAGTLQLPVGDAIAPALVLVAGSGPTDRDGNQPPLMMTDLLKQIAEFLADQGIASLRYDKRGMYANKESLPTDAAKYDEFCSWENFVGDAAAGVRFLRKQARVDPDRVGILGHSEGGMLALEAARVLKDEGRAPAVLILVSAPGRSIDAVITEQLKAILVRQKATAAQTEYFLGENARVIKVIREAGRVPADVPPGLAALYPPHLGKFLRGDLASDPCRLAADFAGPALIIQGSADIQISPNRDAKALDAAFAIRKQDVHTLALIPGVSHNLKVVRTPSDPGLNGPVAAQAMDELRKWVAEHLSRK